MSGIVGSWRKHAVSGFRACAVAVNERTSSVVYISINRDSAAVDSTSECSLTLAPITKKRRECKMLRVGMLRATVLLFSAALLQLQSASGSPLTWRDEPAYVQVPLSASSLIHETKQFVQVCF